MSILKTIWQSFIYLPQAIANGFKQRRLQLGLDQQEAERLDRIRNPSKYLGK